MQPTARLDGKGGEGVPDYQPTVALLRLRRSRSLSLSLALFLFPFLFLRCALVSLHLSTLLTLAQPCLSSSSSSFFFVVVPFPG